MPTTRQRYQVTETPEVERALDLAAQRWPGEARSRLLLKLIAAGSASLGDSVERKKRLEAIRTTSGAYTDEFDSDYLAKLRSDWPS